MNFFQTALLVALLTNLVFGIVTISRKTRRRQNQGFFLTALVLALWLSVLLAGAMARTSDALVFWIRQSSAASALIPVALNLLRLTMVHPEWSWSRLLAKSSFWLVTYTVVLAVCQTTYFLRSADLPVAGQSLATPYYGPGFIVFALYLAASVLVLLYNYIADVRRSTGIQRVELQFLLVACIFSFFLGVLLVILSNVTGVRQLGQLLPLPVLVMDAILAYGVATRSILDIPNVIRRIVASVVMSAYLAALYVLTWGVSSFLLDFVLKLSWPLEHFLAAIAVAFAVAPAQGWMRNFTRRLFMASPPIDVGGSIRNASRILNTIATVDELFEQFARLVHDQIQNEHLRIMILEDHHYEQRYASSPGMAVLEFRTIDPLVSSLAVHDAPLVYDMIQRLPSSENLARAEQDMRRHGIAAAVSMKTKGQAIGMMLLGPRASGRIYGAIEQALLSGLCDQLAISLENAKLYTEVQNSRIYNDILLDRLVSGVIAVNAARQVTVFNREAQRITGLAREQVIDTDVSVLPATLRDTLNHAFTQGGGRDVDATLALNGKEIPIRYGCTPFHSHTGKNLGALLVFTDQTEVKKLEQQVRRTDRLASIGTLAAGMAHEIKNPLVAMKTFTQLLPERYDDADFRQTFSTLLGEEVHRIDRIVNQLLRFARPAKPSLAPLKLHAVVDHTISLLNQQLRQRNIKLNRDYRAENEMIQGDYDMLTQAFLNFFLNALDAMEENGELDLRTEVIQETTNQLDLWGQPVTASRLRLRIADNGKGIAPEALGHVFDPFFTTKATGTGLGLSVAHGIIHEHHGIIEVESAVGVGTTFYVSFPLLAEGVPA